MSLNLIFHISDFHNLKIVNNIFFFIFEGGLIFLSRGVYIIKFWSNDRKGKKLVVIKRIVIYVYKEWLKTNSLF